MRQLLRTGTGAALVVLIMFIGSLVLWIGTPLLWLWVGSQIQGATSSLGAALGAMFVGVIATIALMLLVMRGLGGMSWKQSLLITVPGVMLSYIAFVQLGVPLPRGPLPY